ncbi:hypothetical protein CRENPOLYSF1_430103 [Crenothrix polyspora]|uniref:Uncharacterized protein n=1 Tax=Crenothrix polyspora TaxID=360316 RepID=A0A1R4HB04_9GAMM|nr:hypothetical protein CRENPOLYSF1_430103 [Crenothrix polyspora]
MHTLIKSVHSNLYGKCLHLYSYGYLGILYDNIRKTRRKILSP